MKYNCKLLSVLHICMRLSVSQEEESEQCRRWLELMEDGRDVEAMNGDKISSAMGLIDMEYDGKSVSEFVESETDIGTGRGDELLSDLDGRKGPE
jgi:hypothetical protein